MAIGPETDEELAERLQVFLDRQARALLNGDADDFLETVSLPYRRLSLTHDALVETEKQIRDVLRDYSSSIRNLGTEHLVPRLQMARRLGTDYVEGIYVLHYLGHATQVVPPHDGRVVLVRRDDGWRMIEAERQIATTGWTASISMTHASTKHMLGFAKGDVRGLGQSPRAVYQSFLDALGAAERAKDFGIYIDLMHLPFTAHWNKIDTLISTPEECRPFFDVICKTQSGDISDTLVRHADKAEFVGADLLVGYHTGRAMRDGKDVVEPVSSRMTLKFTGGTWRMINVANTLRNTSFPFDMYHPGNDLPTDLDIQKRTHKWPSSPPQ